MRIAVPKETDPRETRAAVDPDGVRCLVKLGAEVTCGAGVGVGANYSDDAYREAGAEIVPREQDLVAGADIVLRVGPPVAHQTKMLSPGCLHISFLDPFLEREKVLQLAQAGVSILSMQMVPRTTRAQKLDALSSQASLAGYVAVILAADAVDKVFPMMTTPAGTLHPTRVFVIGAGVAGLQAIATAKRLGARVEAFDTRSEVEEQVRSLGARFVKVDLGETGQTAQGYAKALTAEQLDRQRALLAKNCALADVVITTAKVFGKPAPVIVTDEMLRGMPPGAVVVDLSVDTGGNVEGSVRDEIKEVHGVRVIGLGNLPRRVAVHATQMYSSNVVNLLEELWDTDQGQVSLDENDEIVQAALVVREGIFCNECISFSSSS